MPLPDDQDDLWAQMSRAALEEDFELAARLRDEIARASARGEGRTDVLSPTKIRRQTPGAMGLGTDQQIFAPPPDWTPPPKPDLNVAHQKKGGRRRS